MDAQWLYVLYSCYGKANQDSLGPLIFLAHDFMARHGVKMATASLEINSFNRKSFLLSVELSFLKL
jgi:hypothetical protein